MKAALIVNPACVCAEEASVALTAVSARRGWDPPLVLETTIARPGAEQASEAVAAGVRRVVVAGGDGTLRQVAGAMAGSETPIGVMPIGTANIVARNLGLLRVSLERAAETALLAPAGPLSVGWVRCLIGDAWVPPTPMLAVVGIGRDAQAIAATKPWLKRSLGWLAYFASGSRAALEGALPMTVSLDGGPVVDVEAWSILVGAMPRLPLGVVAFWNVAPGDDAFGVMRVMVSHRHQWVAIALKGIFHSPREVPALQYDRAREVLVHPSEPCAVQIDGDLVEGVKEMQVEVEEAAVQVAGAKKR